MRYFYPFQSIYENNKEIPASYLEIPAKHSILTKASSIKMVVYGKSYMKVKDYVTPMIFV